jgi:low affinity Fe/Cu permease
MGHAASETDNRPNDPGRWSNGFSGHPYIEALSQKATNFISGPWGTITLFGILASWALAIPFVGWSRAYQAIDEFITVASFMILFLIQRSQNKGMLSLQVKLNELLAAAHRASPELINVEDRTESEVQEIHDRFQEIQQRGPGAHSIADVLSKDAAEASETIFKSAAAGGRERPQTAAGSYPPCCPEKPINSGNGRT